MLSTLFFSVFDLVKSLIPFFLLLGILVFIHEFGHFIVARYFGVRVEVFSLGFGKKILRWKKGDTLFSIGVIPLGGYVKMFGDQYGHKVSEEEKKVSFLHKKLFARTLIVLAGPLMNFFLAAFIFAGMAMMGDEKIHPVVGSVEKDSYAHQAGFESADRILSVNQKPVKTLSDFQKLIFRNPSRNLDIETQSKTGGKKIIQVQPEKKEVVGPWGFVEEGGVIEGLSYLTSSAVIGVDDPNSPSGRAGLKTFDKILSVDSKDIRTWEELESLLTESLIHREGSNHVVKLEREKEVKEIQLSIPAGLKKERSLMPVLGLQKPDLFIRDLKKGGQAEKAGIQKGDLIFQLDGENVSDWNSLVEQIRGFEPGKEALKIGVKRDGKAIEHLMVPEIRRIIVNGKEEKHYMLGIVSGTQNVHMGGTFVVHQLNPFKAIVSGFSKTFQWCAITGIYIKKLIEGQVSRKALGGVIQIGREAAKTYSYGLEYFFVIMAILSIQLCLINLLPIPVLDGGHLFFYVIEFFKGSPLSMKKMIIAQYMGLFLLLFLFVFTTFNDIDNWIHFW